MNWKEFRGLKKREFANQIRKQAALGAQMTRTGRKGLRNELAARIAADRKQAGVKLLEARECSLWLAQRQDRPRSRRQGGAWRPRCDRNISRKQWIQMSLAPGNVAQTSKV